jgi:hypothetical protein
LEFRGKVYAGLMHWFSSHQDSNALSFTAFSGADPESRIEDLVRFAILPYGCLMRFGSTAENLGSPAR